MTTTETLLPTINQCPRAKLPKGQSVGYCANCDEPVMMGLWGVRNGSWSLAHVSANDPKWQARMARYGQTIR